MVTRTREATGETLLVPSRNRWSKVGRITRAPGKLAEDERVAAGSVGAVKRGNARGAKGPYYLSSSFNTGGRGAMRKAPIRLQDLRRRIYAKAKAEKSWRFWGLFVHVCKLETLYEAYRLAKDNDGAPGVAGVPFEAIAAAGGRRSWSRYGTRWSGAPIDPCGTGIRRFPRATAKATASGQYPRSGTGWSRERSSSSWHRSAKPPCKRARMATDRAGVPMPPSNG